MCIVVLLLMALTGTAGFDDLPVQLPTDVQTDHGVTNASSKPVIVSEDGSLLITSGQYQAVHFGRLIVWAWPYWGGLVALVLLLWVLVKAFTTLRQPQERDERYCRQCGYQLRGLAGSTCPECGNVLGRRTIVVGRSPWGRFLRPAAVPLLCVIVYLVALVAGLPRSGSVSNLFPFESEPLTGWLYRRGWPPPRAILRSHYTAIQRTPGDRATERVLLDSADRRVGFTHHSGRAYITDGRQMIVWDLAAQRVAASLRAPRALWPNPRRMGRALSPYVLDRDSETVAFWYKPPVLWEISTGVVRSLDEAERAALYAIHMGRQRHSAGRWLVDYDNVEGGSEIRIRRHPTGEGRIIRTNQYGNIFHSPDGQTVYFCGSKIVGYDTASGEEVLRIDPPTEHVSFTRGMAVSRDGRWLFISASVSGQGAAAGSAEVLVFDRDHKLWAGRLKLSRFYRTPSMWVHPEEPLLVVTSYVRIQRAAWMGSYPPNPPPDCLTIIRHNISVLLDAAEGDAATRVQPLQSPRFP